MLLRLIPAQLSFIYSVTMFSKVGIKLALAFVLTVSLLVFFPKLRSAHVGRIQNCYERAQRATGLIVTDSGSGSGVVVKRGTRIFLWTAAHVVDDCDSVTIRSYIRHEGARVGQTDFTARILERNDALDIALLWVIAPPEYFESVIFADSELSRVGQSVYHVGNYGGKDFDDSVSIGIISQVGVPPLSQTWHWQFPLDQTTAFVTYGSSGGGIFRHSDNKLIGIIVGSPRPGIADINLFVPIRAIRLWAESAHILWAMYGTESPADVTLTLAAKCAEQRRKAALLPAPPEIPITCPD